MQGFCLDEDLNQAFIKKKHYEEEINKYMAQEGFKNKDVISYFKIGKLFSFSRDLKQNTSQYNYTTSIKHNGKNL